MTVRSIALVLGSAVALAACADTSALVEPTPVPAVAFDENCNPLIQYCEDPGGGGGPPPTPPGIALGISQQYCHVATAGTLPDADGDNINDTCEYQLAAAFAPMLVHGSEHEPGWNITLSLPGIPGEYLFAVGKGNGGYPARIAYLPAYYKDGGDLYFGSATHSGDSEFIMVDLGYNAQTGRWYTARVFLSAHCGSMLFGIFNGSMNCQWYGPDDFEYVDAVRWGAPVVWVADQKPANYRTFSACQGGTGIDRCDIGPRMRQRFPIGPAFEILPVPGTNWIYRNALRAGAPLVDPTKTEMFSYTFYRPFTGWQSPEWGDAAVPYGAILARFAIIPNNGGGDPMPPCESNIQVC